MMDISNAERASILVHALPYIQDYNNKIIVVKYGGNAMVNEELKDSVMRDIVLLSLIGVKVVLVHGGGPEITELLAKMGKKSEFVDGLRVTDKETVEVVQMVLAGKINKNLVNLIENKNGKAIGLSGMDGHMIEAEMKDERLGFVGTITSINVKPILDVLEKGYIPVISTIGCDKIGNVYNINADTAAAKIAGALEAEIRGKQAASLAGRPGLEAAGVPAAGLEAGGWPASVPPAPNVEVIDATWVAPPPRARGSIRRIVVHHTGTRAGLTAAAAIRRQLSRGKGDGGYHYLVTRDGTIHQINAPHTIVNQSRVRAVDRDAVAVALVGDFDLAAPSAAQLAAAAHLIAHLITDLGLAPDAVVGRSEVERGTTSPGLQWAQGVAYRVDLLALVRRTLGLR